MNQRVESSIKILGKRGRKEKRDKRKEKKRKEKKRKEKKRKEKKGERLGVNGVDEGKNWQLEKGGQREVVRWLGGTRRRNGRRGGKKKGRVEERG